MPVFVSVIIPVYNDPMRIAICLDALIEQTYSRDSYEIIVADNGSTDEALCVVQDYSEKYPDLVRIVVENEIQSSYAARNKAVAKARGEIFAFTDSDCIPEPDWIALGVQTLEKQSAPSGGGHIEFFFKDERPNIMSTSTRVANSIKKRLSQRPDSPPRRIFSSGARCSIATVCFAAI